MENKESILAQRKEGSVTEQERIRDAVPKIAEELKGAVSFAQAHAQSPDGLRKTVERLVAGKLKEYSLPGYTKGRIAQEVMDYLQN